MTEARPETVAAWTALVTTSRRLVDGVEAELKRADLPPLAWYDALWEVEKAGDAGLRPFVLKDRLLLPQYATSRLLDRIEAAGLVHREACDGDGRGQVIRLTEKGAETRRRMWPVYAGALQRLIGDRAQAAELAALAGLLTRLGAGTD